MFKWFDASIAKEFGESLARFAIERIPKEANKDDKVFVKKTEKVLGQLAQQVVKFKQGNDLNYYKKAQLGNAFKWTLRDAGFSEAYIDELTRWLMVRI